MYELVDRIVRVLKKIVPEPVVRPLRPAYHRALAYFMAFSYDFPARKLTVIGVTGTKGKSTVAEMLFAILREAGYKTALISTVRFAIKDDSEPNQYKMTSPGRGFIQAFMHRALKAECTHIVIEISSESVLQYRHWFLELDGLIVTNIQREHIESHGSFANYVAAKRAIVTALVRSHKRFRVLVANEDIPESRAFLSAHVSSTIGFSAHELQRVSGNEQNINFEYAGIPFSLPIPGIFNAMNALAAVKLSAVLGISLTVAAVALKKLQTVRGRVERIEAGQDFLVIVDYAHTPDSLRALYGIFTSRPADSTRKLICVLGNTGGGRDTWKRPEMGRIADEECEKVILTNEDSYDEDPSEIVAAMARGMKRAPEIIMDRRMAIRAALRAAQRGDVVFITGKGTDPFIMGAHGAKIPWSDADVVREELERLLKKV
ncbi:MAG: UDP-N-acetylmuramyl-tripeptide synthetase [Minisyncoccia bacterium]|jgi:UDP-N-acetylmuramoyl-L-alanyl-D-glutamate--2,6-diaminopimelate ligase